MSFSTSKFGPIAQVRRDVQTDLERQSEAKPSDGGCPEWARKLIDERIADVSGPAEIIVSASGHFEKDGTGNLNLSISRNVT